MDTLARRRRCQSCRAWARKFEHARADSSRILRPRMASTHFWLFTWSPEGVYANFTSRGDRRNSPFAYRASAKWSRFYGGIRSQVHRSRCTGLCRSRQCSTARPTKPRENSVLDSFPYKPVLWGPINCRAWARRVRYFPQQDARSSQVAGSRMPVTTCRIASVTSSGLS